MRVGIVLYACLSIVFEVNVFALGQDAGRAAFFGGRARVPLAAVWRRDAGRRRRGRCDFLVSVAAGADGDLSPDFFLRG